LETIKLIGAILGGLGLFLLAIGMMTDGLKLAAGSSLRKLLSNWSRTPLRGIFSGFFMTAIVQSSSAVTVASLGFVNAGLINMRQALGIIYGANVGTTMTGWLVALIGFKLNIQAFALPMIGIGMVIKLVKQHGRAASFGLALVGFGLFFVGIDVLKNAFDGIVQVFDITRFSANGIVGVFVFLLIGIVMTILTQSSSASIALTITAASSGIVGVYAAGAMVIGANVGTTSTALVASIGATSHAKRVAAAQVIFNLVTALVALITLPLLFFLIESLSIFFGFTPNPAISLALFHTVFNILGVLLVYPQNDRLVAFLEQRFISCEEKQSQPRFLDKTLADTPVLAVNALMLEIFSISEKVALLFSRAIHTSKFDLRMFENEANIIKLLSTKVSNFIVNIESSALAGDTTANLATLMRVEQYLLSCTLCAERIAEQLNVREKLTVSSLETDTNKFFKHILDFMNESRSKKFETVELFSAQLGELQAEHDKLKAELLLEATRAKISVTQMSLTIDCLAEAIRTTQLWFKAFVRLHHLEQQLGPITGTLDDRFSNI
jgi:phosphate:Na+ symporter